MMRRAAVCDIMTRLVARRPRALSVWAGHVQRLRDARAMFEDADIGVASDCIDDSMLEAEDDPYSDLPLLH